MSRKRLDVTIRKSQILDAAMVLAEEFGYTNISRGAIAGAADCSVGLVSLHFGTMPSVKRAIVSAAINRENLVIIAQAMVDRHPKVNNAPDELKRRALAFILGE